MLIVNYLWREGYEKIQWDSNEMSNNLVTKYNNAWEYTPMSEMRELAVMAFFHEMQRYITRRAT